MMQRWEVDKLKWGIGWGETDDVKEQEMRKPAAWITANRDYQTKRSNHDYSEPCFARGGLHEAGHCWSKCLLHCSTWTGSTLVWWLTEAVSRHWEARSSFFTRWVRQALSDLPLKHHSKCWALLAHLRKAKMFDITHLFRSCCMKCHCCVILAQLDAGVKISVWIHRNNSPSYPNNCPPTDTAISQN